MPGKIYEIISGGRIGQFAFVDNKQEKQILEAKKLHAYFFDKVMQPIVIDGKHLNGLISADRLKVTGYYD